MSTITTFRPTRRPEPMTPERRLQLDSALNALEGPENGYIHASRRPDEFRSYLTKRREEELTPAFRGLSFKELSHLLTSFLGAYAQAGKFSEVGLEDYLEQAYEALKTSPLWLLEDVVSRFRRGVTGNPSHVPTVPELAQDADRLMDPWVAEAADIGRVLHAQVFHDRIRTPEELARIDAMVAGYRAGLRGPAIPEPMPEEDLARLAGLNVEEVRERLAALPDAPVTPARLAYLERAKTADPEGLDTRKRVALEIAAAADAHLERMRKAFPGESDLAIARRYRPRPQVLAEREAFKRRHPELRHDTPRAPGWDSRFTQADGSPLPETEA